MKKNLLTIVIGAVLVVIFVLLLFVFQVRQSEVAVVATFGKPSAAYNQPGAYFKWPWPVQNVYKFDQRIQNFEDKFSESPLADSTALFTSIYVGWQISDASVFITKFPGDSSVSIPTAQKRLEELLRSTKNNILGKHALAEFVNSDPQALKFDDIQHDIETAVQSELAAQNWGIRVDFLGFKKIGLPESVTQTVFDRMKSERQKLISVAESDGKKQAMIIQSSADREAAETIAGAQAAATRIAGEAQAEAAKTLPVFEQDPELAKFLLRLDAFKSSLNQKSTLFLDERTPPFDLFKNLP